MPLVAALSDLHNNFQLGPPEKCDFFVFAGDFFGCKGADPHTELLRQRDDLGHLLAWLNQIPAREIICVAGNHDYLFSALGHTLSQEVLSRSNKKITYLENNSYETDGISFWGTPHVAFRKGARYPQNRAFALEEDRYLESRLESADIVISHNSPWQKSCDPENWIDSHSCARHLQSEIMRTKPRAVISGHFHWMRGRSILGKTDLIIPPAVCAYGETVEKYTPLPDPYFYLEV